MSGDSVHRDRSLVMSAPGKAPLTIWGLQDAEGVLETAARYFAPK